jgi:hypothetical protein
VSQWQTFDGRSPCRPLFKISQAIERRIHQKPVSGEPLVPIQVSVTGCLEQKGLISGGALELDVPLRAADVPRLESSARASSRCLRRELNAGVGRAMRLDLELGARVAAAHSATPALRRPAVNLSASAGSRKGKRPICSTWEYLGFIRLSSCQTSRASSNLSRAC